MLVTKDTNVQDYTTWLNSQLGIDGEGKLNGEYVYIRVLNMRTGYRCVPMGKIQISVPIHGSRKDKIFRTRKDGSTPVEEIKSVLNDYVVAKADSRKYAMAREHTKELNQSMTDRVRGAYVGKRFISSYASGASTFISPSTSDVGRVRVAVDFGALTEDQALEVIALMNKFQAQ